MEAASDTWDSLLKRVRELVLPAMIRPEESRVQEDYLIGLVHSLRPDADRSRVAGSVDLVPLLSGEQRPLSDGARQDLLRQRFSYYTDDLVVLAWDRAFIYEPRGDSDVLDVLEVANAQLLEMRYYDELLDDELPRMYDLVAKARRARTLLTSRRFANLARRLHTLVAEVTELTERVDNALQVTEDVYLARIYAAALELFRVPAVNAAVDRKLAIIRDTYSALYDESSASRTGTDGSPDHRPDRGRDRHRPGAAITKGTADVDSDHHSRAYQWSAGDRRLRLDRQGHTATDPAPPRCTARTDGNHRS